jgi:protein-S-isoprenylcysteine O-methyltransferase Ste14
MDKTALTAIYLLGLLFAESLRLPRRIERLRDRQDWIAADRSTQKAEWIVMIAVILGIWVLPGCYAFTSWLIAFDYRLPEWLSWAAIFLFVISLILRLVAQRTLSRSWSFTVEISGEHQLVTHGLFSITRHPIYLSLIFWAVAQPVLLANYLAGLGGAAAVLLIWLIRVPREEQLLLEVFGDKYENYRARTGILGPRRRREA